VSDTTGDDKRIKAGNKKLLALNLNEHTLSLFVELLLPLFLKNILAHRKS